MEHIKELIRMATHFNVTPDYDNVLQYIYDSERQFLLNILNDEELPSELNQLLDLAESATDELMAVQRNVLGSVADKIGKVYPDAPAQTAEGEQ